ncbi:hypothetical protein BO86DRAFT_393766 [Aspergillus japonicus CBS 114.51]|uniref:Secreted protein n=1 Tax=Aspergillus japonicus CBS 114.51 TaxID=1448312 RepID=A0A8T8WJU5_ASPJA|nr:hypothetical protein BO86DRAFT_393766 [Aspergillus japonicus CBS 114.51]RAH76017.1 hypothetical protein BO86DRAFT_393766 [Aspergillus japonicus CBS 114.51]
MHLGPGAVGWVGALLACHQLPVLAQNMMEDRTATTCRGLLYLGGRSMTHAIQYRLHNQGGHSRMEMVIIQVSTRLCGSVSGPRCGAKNGAMDRVVLAQLAMLISLDAGGRFGRRFGNRRPIS